MYCMVTFNEYVSSQLAKSPLFKKVPLKTSYGMSNAYTGQITKSAGSYNYANAFTDKLIAGAKSQRNKGRDPSKDFSAADAFTDKLIAGAKQQRDIAQFGGMPTVYAFDPDPLKKPIQNITDGFFKPLDTTPDPLTFPQFDPFGMNAGVNEIVDTAKDTFNSLPIILIGGLALFLLIKGGK